MKAIVITRFGDPSVLQVQEVAEPVPDADQLLIKVHATAVNRADLLQRRGKYPPPAGVRPDIPGLEFAGEVEKIGRRVEIFRAGDRVMGLLPGEGYAEKVVIGERLAMAIPPNMSYEEAAAIPEVFLTAYDALFKRLGLRKRESLLLHAVGSGVGTAALQLSKATGATVFGTAGTDEKLEKARQLGLDFGINYRNENFAEKVRSATAGRGVDAILDVVGAAYLESNLACLANRGRMVLVGLLGGPKAEIDLATLMGKRLRIEGTVLRTRTLREKIALTRSFVRHGLPLLAAGKIRPVIDKTWPLAKAAEAHAYMEANRNFGKIVLKVIE